MHRKCVGLTRNAFTLIEEPYLCPYCCSNYYKKEINNLKELVKSLSNRLSCLEKSSPADASSGTDSATNEVNNLLTNQHSQSGLPTKSAPHQPATLLTNKPPTSLPVNSVDRKFNLVIYGVKRIQRVLTGGLESRQTLTIVFRF